MAIILGTNSTLGVPFRAGARHSRFHTGRIATAWADAFQIESRQLPNQLVVGNDFLDDVTWMGVGEVLRSGKIAGGSSHPFKGSGTIEDREDLAI